MTEQYGQRGGLLQQINFREGEKNSLITLIRQLLPFPFLSGKEPSADPMPRPLQLYFLSQVP
jgi:hypothetical protein